MKHLISLLFILLFSTLSAQTLAFPTAMGGGAYARNDIPYSIVEVTNLNPDGAGSFFSALGDNRIIVFRVSGIINMGSIGGTKTFNNCIVLGQTAPDGGITVVGRGWRWENCSNVVFRYVRFRTWQCQTDVFDPCSADAIDVIGSNNIIFDHCSFAFGGDETLSFRGASHTITVQNSAFAYNKTAMLLGDSNDYTLSYDMSLINNYFMDTSHRFPNPNSNGRVDVIGNVVYNWLNRLMRTGGTVELNEIGNAYVAPKMENSGGTTFQGNKLDATPAPPTVYTSNNRLTNVLTANGQDNTVLWQAWDGGRDPLPSDFTNTMYPLLNFTIPIPDGDDSIQDIVDRKRGANAYLDDSGNRVTQLDDLDIAAYNDFDNRTFFDWNSSIDWEVIPERTWLTDNNPNYGVIQNSHNQTTHTGVVPNSWITAQGLTPATFDPVANDLDVFYTNVEMYSFNIDGASVSVPATSVTINEADQGLEIGETLQLTSTVLPANASNKSVTWSSNNNSIATVSSSGLVTAIAEGSVIVTVTTNDGSFTDTINLNITTPLQLAFPTAVGAGAYVTGGRGGTVIHVTNLNDSGAGSFREALESTGTRIIVFDVSGRIDLQSRINLDTSNSNVTIAGQTAPEGGITITGKPIRFGTDPNPTNNVIVRYMRFRNGSFTGVPDVYDHNGLLVQSINGLILDHCSFSFCNDQAIGMSGRYADLINITVQKCIFSQNATGIIAGLSREFNEGDMTFIYNLFSSQGWRTPNVGGNLQYDIINNVVYNYYVRTTTVNGDINSGLDLNYVGNYIEEATWGGLGTIVPPTRWQNNGNTPSIYSAYNYHDRYQTTPILNDQSIWTDFTSNDATQIPVPSQFFITTQHPLLGETYNIMSALEAKDYVIADVGNNKYLNEDGSLSEYIDTYDTDRINDVINKTAINPVETSYVQPILPNNVRPGNFYVSNPHIPEVWFQANVPSGQTESDIAPNNYTWIENYLNEVDGEIVEPPTPPVTPSGNMSLKTKRLLISN